MPWRTLAKCRTRSIPRSTTEIDRFITDNHRDVTVGITEVRVVRPADLPEP